MNIEKIINETFNEPLQNIQNDTIISELSEWDSMSYMLFITKIEEEFSIHLDGDEIASIQTVNDLKKLLESKTRILS